MLGVQLDSHPENNFILFLNINNKSMEAPLAFPRGAIYHIICKSGDFALKIQESDPANYKDSRVCGVPLNPQDDSQLFMIEKVSLDADGFEIVNCKSNLVFDESWKEIKLAFGKQSSDQLFSIVKASVQGFYQYYWIKTSEKGDKALFFEGIMRYGTFDPNNENQLFRFEISKANNTVNNSSIIVNKMSGKALDIPQASFKKEERIIQWERNRRFNQRWRLVKTGTAQNGQPIYAIQSVLNGLFFDIAGESRDDGAKVIQWSETGNPNQQWTFEAVANGVYRIRSVHEKSLYLGIKKQSVEDGAYLVCQKELTASNEWQIEGRQP